MQAQTIAQESTGSNTLEYSKALNSDIIKTIHKNYVRGVQQMQKHAPQFKGRNTTQTARNIWNFLKKEITYKRDPDHAQLIKLPGRLAADKTGDCKSYSLFAASVLGALGKPVTFRYTSYNNDTTPSHVYLVTKDETGQDVIIDAVYNKFNSQKPYTNKIDKKMKVYTLAGIGSIGSDKTPSQGFIKSTLSKGKRLSHIALKLPLAASRGSFLVLVKNNVFGLASKLYVAVALNKKSKQLSDLWYGLGGKYASNLWPAVLKGYKKKPIFNKKANISGIGEPVTSTVTGGFLASAAAVTAMLKDLTDLGQKTISDAKASAKNLGIPVDDILNQAGGGTSSGSSGGGAGNNPPQTVTLRLLSSGPGKLTLNRSPYNIPVNTRVTATATPAPGYVAKWSNGHTGPTLQTTVLRAGQEIKVQFVRPSGPKEDTPTPPAQASAGLAVPLLIGAGLYFLNSK